MTIGPRALLALALCAVFALLPRIDGPEEVEATTPTADRTDAEFAASAPSPEGEPFSFDALISSLGAALTGPETTASPPVTISIATIPIVVDVATVPSSIAVQGVDAEQPRVADSITVVESSTTAPSTTAAPVVPAAAPATVTPTTVTQTTATPTTAASTGNSIVDQMFALVAFDWRSAFPDWVVEFEGERVGIRALTFPAEKRIVVYVRSDDTVESLHRVFAHELGHVVDVELNSNAEREQWRQQRAIASDVPWWPSAEAPDFATGAGDFAETFAVLETGITTRSTVGAQPTSADLALMRELMRG